MKQQGTKQPRLVVFSTLFPNPGQPNAGVFIRERMFRVAQHIPIVVVAPVAWFPGQAVIRRFKPHFRPEAPFLETQEGIAVYHPRFFSIPGLFKWLDGYFLAFSSYLTLKKLNKEFNFNIIDSHFAYPDGFAATRLAKWFSVPVTITLRGTEVPHSKAKTKLPFLKKAFNSASKLFSVSNSLKLHAISLGAEKNKISVVGNGVDINKFYPLDRQAMREKFILNGSAPILITVGALVERKGFHRVIELMPKLIKKFPDLQYLLVGGATAEGDWTDKLKALVKELNLESHVIFMGPMPPVELKEILSAADVFVLSTRNEGWANVILEAMACGLPVIASDVGGNAEVVSHDDIGSIVPFDEADELYWAIEKALQKNWERDVIIKYAQDNSWEQRVNLLLKEFAEIIR